MSEISTKPYLLRAIYEWCTDNGYTPYIAVVVDANTRVPMQFVQNGEIVLNISFDATSGLKIDNDCIQFHARFGGVSREIFVPIENVVAIYSRENGQGMAFDLPKLVVKKSPDAEQRDDGASPLSAVPSQKTEATEVDATTGPEDDTDPPKKGGRPTLTRIK